MCLWNMSASSWYLVVDLFENPPAEFAPTRQLHPDFDVREGGHRQALLLTEGHHLHGLGRPAERPQRLGCFTALLLAPGSPQKMRKTWENQWKSCFCSWWFPDCGLKWWFLHVFGTYRHSIICVFFRYIGKSSRLTVSYTTMKASFTDATLHKPVQWPQRKRRGAHGSKRCLKGSCMNQYHQTNKEEETSAMVASSCYTPSRKLLLVMT